MTSRLQSGPENSWLDKYQISQTVSFWRDCCWSPQYKESPQLLDWETEMWREGERNGYLGSIAVTQRHQAEKYLILFSRLENPPSTLFSSSIEFSTMEVIPLYSASIAMSHSRTENCTASAVLAVHWTVLTPPLWEVEWGALQVPPLGVRARSSVLETFWMHFKRVSYSASQAEHNTMNNVTRGDGAVNPGWRNKVWPLICLGSEFFSGQVHQIITKPEASCCWWE